MLSLSIWNLFLPFDCLVLDLSSSFQNEMEKSFQVSKPSGPERKWAQKQKQD
jgi:hypothetical protein